VSLCAQDAVWNEVTHAGGQVRNPQRNLPLALIGGLATFIGYALIGLKHRAEALRAASTGELRANHRPAA
jgi:hypothetical protein